MKHKRRKEVLNRLSRIEGHVKGLRRMAEREDDCPDILVQISAVRAALSQVGRVLLEDHMETCILEAARDGTGKEAVADLKAALERYIDS